MKYAYATQDDIAEWKDIQWTKVAQTIETFLCSNQTGRLRLKDETHKVRITVEKKDAEPCYMALY